jgi:hypothetical protein
MEAGNASPGPGATGDERLFGASRLRQSRQRSDIDPHPSADPERRPKTRQVPDARSLFRIASSGDIDWHVP